MSFKVQSPLQTEIVVSKDISDLVFPYTVSLTEKYGVNNGM